MLVAGSQPYRVDGYREVADGYAFALPCPGVAPTVIAKSTAALALAIFTALQATIHHHSNKVIPKLSVNLSPRLDYAARYRLGPSDLCRRKGRFVPSFLVHSHLRCLKPDSRFASVLRGSSSSGSPHAGNTASEAA